MNALLIFIKNPVKGKVKTRLAQTVGEDQALMIYLELLRHTRDIAQQVDANRLLYYSHFIDQEDEWSKDIFHKVLQQGNDLGAKMGNAFEQALSTHKKAVIIGSDCASLTPEIVNEAFRLLDHYDFVLGPAIDGGYYLLGMKSFYPEVFENIAWSTDEVAAATIDRIDALHKTYSLLPLLSDIDYEEDWKKYGWPLKKS